MTTTCPPNHLMNVCRKLTSDKQRKEVERTGWQRKNPFAKRNDNTAALARFRSCLQSDAVVRKLERHPLPKRSGERYSPLLSSRAELIEQIDSFFTKSDAAHKDQVGLFILADKLLQKEEFRRSVCEGTILTTSEQQERYVANPQKVLQMINRVLQESDQISIQIRVSAPRKSSPYCFVAGMIGAAERILRFPLRHHNSVIQAAKGIVEAFSTLRALVADHIETSCKALNCGSKGVRPEDSLAMMENDEELVAIYEQFGNQWKRFTYLLFKERAYQLIQVDEDEIQNLMETTSRLSA